MTEIASSGADSAVYAEVSYIFLRPWIEVEDNTKVWLVAYQDGYAGLQLKRGQADCPALEKRKRAVGKILSGIVGLTLMPKRHEKWTKTRCA